MVTLDPGLNNIGMSFWDLSAHPVHPLFIESLTLQSHRVRDRVSYNDDLVDDQRMKLNRMIDAVMSLIIPFGPSIIAFEAPFFDRLRPSSYAILVRIVSEIEQRILNWNSVARIYAIPPQSVKMAVGKAGIKGKEVIKEAVAGIDEIQSALVTDFNTLDEHAIDSLAVGYSCIQMYLRY